MKKVIIFDFDGTTASTMDVADLIYMKISNSFGFKKFTQKEINELKHLSIHDRMKKHSLSIFQLPKLVRKIRKILVELIDQAPIFEGMKPLLEDLSRSGYTLAILSSNSKENIMHFVNKHEIDVFEYICGGAAFFGKEQKLKKLIRKFKVNKEEVIYVGDEVRDILSCKSFGIDIVAISYGFDDKDILKVAEPTYLAGNIMELRNILESR